MSNLASLIVGTSVSTIITLVVSLIFYMRAGRELRQEAKKLRKLHQLTLIALTDRNAKFSPKYDADGNIDGLTLQLEGRISAQAKASAAALTTDGPR